MNLSIHVKRLAVYAGYAAVSAVLAGPVTAWAIDGAEIVQHCDVEANAGADQRSVLTVILRDAAGNEKKNVYRRYWIKADGKDDIVDKMILFTEYPPDAAGTAFMRWGFVPESDKNADQWLYLPSLKSTRKVSVRDPGDSFLGSDLTYQDISLRRLSADEHVLLREETDGGRTYYVVQSTPKESNPLYSKVVTWYNKVPDWNDCNKSRIEYFDSSHALLKVQTLVWQKVGEAWLWDEVKVNNIRTGHNSIFRVTEPEVNVGLKDRMFSERTLKRGIH